MDIKTKKSVSAVQLAERCNFLKDYVSNSSNQNEESAPNVTIGKEKIRSKVNKKSDPNVTMGEETTKFKQLIIDLTADHSISGSFTLELPVAFFKIFNYIKLYYVLFLSQL